MSNRLTTTDRAPILTRYKVFEEKHHLNRKVYRNRGVLKDAERFSLVDTVLDGEYNDFEILEGKNRSAVRWQEFRKKTANYMSHFGRSISGGAFRILLAARLTVYYLLHTRYKAE